MPHIRKPISRKWVCQFTLDKARLTTKTDNKTYKEHRNGLADALLETFKEMGAESVHVLLCVFYESKGLVEPEPATICPVSNQDSAASTSVRLAPRSQMSATDHSADKRDAARIRKTTKAEVLAFFRLYVAASGKARAKLSIQCRSQRLQPAQIVEPLKDILAGEDAKLTADLVTMLDSKPTIQQLLVKVDDPAIADKIRDLLKPPSATGGALLLSSEGDEAFRAGLIRPSPPRPIV